MSAGRAARLALWLAITAAAPPLARADPVIVNDVTQLNPIEVEREVRPTSVEEIQQLVRETRSPISIGGGRFSMGGQIASEGTVHVDMRGMDRVLAVSQAEKTITVQTGITWRKIQETIDPLGLSVEIMQSYANFSVGGSLSVNVHGRYVGQGPLIGSVRSIRMVLADGSLVEASPTQNRELFYGAIGGYGGLGIIVEATLDLADDRRVERSAERLPITAYADFFRRTIRDSPDAVFHNGDIYPPAYEHVLAITYSATDRDVTVPDRLAPPHVAGWYEHLKLFLMANLPGAEAFREQVIDRVRYRGHPVVWRNYEAGYDVRELEPRSRASSTYVLQEYFVPVARFDDFVPKMRDIFRRHDVDVLNVSIRHARPDPGSLLAWAREEVFAFVVYYRQGVAQADRDAVRDWTRELIDAALSVGGTYYLPYQLHATDEQFHRAYPRAQEYFALKRRLDPGYRFRNKLWDRYLPPPPTRASAARTLRETPGYLRAGDQSLLTIPEWYIVYSADEYAQFVGESRRPSGFPFFRSIGQFWRVYAAVLGATWDQEPFNWGYHTMIGVIGLSYTAEYAVRGLYEGTLGRLMELVDDDTDEDRFARRVAGEYATFIHATPWYEFPFWQKMGELWDVSPLAGGVVVRKWERRLWLSADLAFKTGWAWVIRKGSGAAYDPEQQEMLVWTDEFPDRALDGVAHVRVLDPPEAHSRLLAVPRYEPFTATVAELSRRDVRFLEIAGNREIALTLIAPRDWDALGDGARPVHEWSILTAPAMKRVAATVAVDELHHLVPTVEAAGVTIDHLYDY